MKRQIALLLALVLAVLLCACGEGNAPAPSAEPSGTVPAQTESTTQMPELPANHFSNMRYVRPELDRILQAQASCARLAQGDNWYELVDALRGTMTLVSDYHTNCALAQIHYSLDISDSTWAVEYNYCMENMPALQTGQDVLMRALAKSGYRGLLEGKDFFGPGYFRAYDAEGVWTEEFTALMRQEAQLRSQYYTLSIRQEDGASQLSGLLADMVKLRQELARTAGYPDYPTFAYEFYFHRDYTPAQARAYLQEIRQCLVPLFREKFRDVNTRTLMGEGYGAQPYAYVKTLAENAGGGIEKAFRLMEERGLYDLTSGENKLKMSFETYLGDYRVPFVFLSPVGSGQDALGFTHEFGHFCNDHASAGSSAGMDVKEFFSQGLEYLSLCYGGAEMESFKLYDSLRTYVEQAAYASFELELYALPEESLTGEGIRALFDTVCRSFGSGDVCIDSKTFDAADFARIGHFYVSPMYVMGYVVSNDAALQLYRLERQEPGAGLRCYTENLATHQSGFLAFTQETGLESPFASGRMEKVAAFFTENLI